MRTLRHGEGQHETQLGEEGSRVEGWPHGEAQASAGTGGLRLGEMVEIDKRNFPYNRIDQISNYTKEDGSQLSHCGGTHQYRKGES